MSSYPATSEGVVGEVASIVANLAHSDPHDGDGFCHHCEMLPLTKHDVHDDDGPYVIVGRVTHRPDCLWVRARAAARIEDRARYVCKAGDRFTAHPPPGVIVCPECGTEDIALDQDQT